LVQLLLVLQPQQVQELPLLVLLPELVQELPLLVLLMLVQELLPVQVLPPLVLLLELVPLLPLPLLPHQDLPQKLRTETKLTHLKSISESQLMHLSSDGLGMNPTNHREVLTKNLLVL
jgi:hypothetical protein